MTTSREALVTQIREWGERKRRAEREAEEAAVILHSLEETLAKLESPRTTAGGPSPQTQRPSRGPKAIRGPIEALLQEFRAMAVQEIEKLLRERYGLRVSHVAIRYNLENMVKEGEARREKAPIESGARLAYRLVENSKNRGEVPNEGDETSNTRRATR